MDWENLRHLAALAMGGNLSAAARQLGVEHATVARRIAALEESLELKLVDRRGRRLVLTSDGERIAAIAERMEEETQAIRRMAAGARSELGGEVAISAPPSLAAARLVAPLVALRMRHSALIIRIIGESRSAALERREADIAVRLGRPETGDLTIMKLGEIAFRLYASPTYLAETSEAEWVFVGNDVPLNRSAQQRALEAAAAGRPLGILASTVEIQRAAARTGAGIAMLPDFMTEGDEGLAPVRPKDPPLLRELWLVVHTDLKSSAPIRAVVQALKEAFATSTLSAASNRF